MSIFEEKSCRICLRKNTGIVQVFGKFHSQSVSSLISSICRVKLNKNKNLPQLACELCLTTLLQAESIKKLCEKNEKFLSELSTVARFPLIPPTAKVKLEPEDYEDEINFEDEIFAEECERPITPIEYPEELERPETPEENFDWEPYLKINEKSKEKNKKAPTSFYCSHCFKEFNTRAKCLYHERSKHQPKPMVEARPFTCDRCGMTFKHKSHVINHLNVVHLRIKRYQCNICGFAMYSKTHHKNHMVSHSAVKEFKCMQCGKAFSRKEALVVHQRTHDGLRPYQCKYCERSYTAHTDLKRHIFIHTQVHPYICKICDEGYHLKRLLVDHVAAVHSGVDTTMWLNGKTFHHF